MGPIGPAATKSPEDQALACAQTEAWMSLAVAAAMQCGHDRADVAQLAEYAWDNLTALQNAAAAEAGKRPRRGNGARP